MISALHLAGKRPSGLWPPPWKGHQLGIGEFGHRLAARIGLQPVVVTVDHQHRTADLAVHRLAEIELRCDRPRLDDAGQYGAGGLGGPFDAVLDLPGRVRVGKDVANEELREVGIVGQPVLAVVLVPAVEILTPGRKMRRRHVGVSRPDSGRGSGQDERGDAVGMIRRDHACDHAAERQSDDNSLFRAGRIHHRNQIGDVIVQAVRRDIVWPVGFAIAAAVIGDAAKPFAEVRQLRLVHPGMNDAPRRHEDDGLRAVAIDLIIEFYAVAFGKPFLIGQLCTHDVTLRLHDFPRCE